VREWNQVGLLRGWREHWADLANQHLMRAGYDVHVDHRSFKDQGIELEPTSHLGRRSMKCAGAANTPSASASSVLRRRCSGRPPATTREMLAVGW
jgi:hypothetical protein